MSVAFPGSFTNDVISLLVAASRDDAEFREELLRNSSLEDAPERFRANICFATAKSLGSGSFITAIAVRALSDYVDWPEVVSFFKS